MECISLLSSQQGITDLVASTTHLFPHSSGGPKSKVRVPTKMETFEQFMCFYSIKNFSTLSNT